MSTLLNRQKVRNKLNNFELKSLFFDDLGWDNINKTVQIQLNDKTFTLNAIAQKRGMIAFSLIDKELNSEILKKIEKKLSEQVHEHIIINLSNNTQY